MYRWMCDPDVSANLGLRSQPSIEKTVAWIEGALADDSVEPFAILFQGGHVGNVVFDRIDRYLATARLSVYIGEPAARGAGIASTGMYLAMAEMFDRLGMHKIWLTVHDRNYHGINAYIRLGYAIEGVLRDEFLLDGKRTNALYMGVLDSDFRGLTVDRSGSMA
jgi:RimJ/RimL family protein N-acetyltransferase